STTNAGAGVVAEGNGTSGTALTIQNGAISVAGAGVGTNTPAFIHIKTPSNTCGGSGGLSTALDNPYTNGDPNALVFALSSNPYGRVDAGVYYPAGSTPPSCPFFANRWVLFLSLIAEASNIPDGTQFSVLVIKR